MQLNCDVSLPLVAVFYNSILTCTSTEDRWCKLYLQFLLQQHNKYLWIFKYSLHMWSIRSTDDQEALFDQILMGQLDFPLPYWDNVSDSAKVGVPKQSLKVLERKTNLTLFLSYFLSVQALITCMLQVEVDQRYTALQLLDHPWVNVRFFLLSICTILRLLVGKWYMEVLSCSFSGWQNVWESAPVVCGRQD